MTTTTTTTLSDIPRASIKRITWVSLRGRLYFITDGPGIDAWVERFGSVPLQMLDRGWCTIEPSVPYRSFEVFI